MTAILWFRQDLRLSDNPALCAALEQKEIIPIYIMDNTLGAASRVWLHHSLENLNRTLDNHLNIYEGDPLEILSSLIKEHTIEAVYWNRCYEPWRIKQDTHIKNTLKNEGVHVESFNASLLWEPWQLLKKDNTYYKVFTPYYKNALLHTHTLSEPLAAPDTLNLKKISTLTIDSLNLLPARDWGQEMSQHWHIGEQATLEKLDEFLEYSAKDYTTKRDYPALSNTSHLSPHLHFGEISPRQIWHVAKRTAPSSGLDCFLKELIWREFSYYLLYHFPELPDKNFNPKFDAFPWDWNSKHLAAWQKGQTGYPIVDAGMRELWATGYMHNRVRMVVASFLIKNLNIHWRIGADWFWDCLVDADLASNSASWQWCAGSGADAAPFFRIFNPVTQAEKFDEAGKYIRQWVPELSALPEKYIANPWEAPDFVLQMAHIKLGVDYPKPIIDLKKSRESALASYKAL